MMTYRLLALKLASSRGAMLGYGISLVLGTACDGAPARETANEAPEAAFEASSASTYQAPSIDIGRSLAVVDLPTLGALDAQGRERFSFERVLSQLASTSGATRRIGPLELYRRLWDTNNTKALGVVPDGQHCDDQKDASGKPVLNGVPIECPRQEAALSDVTAHHPFCSGDGCDPYSPVAIVNRFDLAPSNGQHCGQYRIVFGKGVRQTPVHTAGNQDVFDRNLIIFEAILPNPHPSQGLAACAPVVASWAALSSESSPTKRAAALDRFFFSGIPGFAPAFQFAHFTGAVDPQNGTQTSGQIRANQFMFARGGQGWQLREYNLERRCTGAGSAQRCDARVKMVPPKLNPDASLFDDANTSPRALAFRDPANPKGFFSQIPALAVRDVNLLNMNELSPEFNGGQSTASPLFVDPTSPPGQAPTALDDTNYLRTFKLNGPFSQAIQAELVRRRIKLGSLHIVRRAQAQSCAGCHELSTSTASFFGGKNEATAIGDGLVWPDAAVGVIPLPAFTQTSESTLVPLAPGVTCDAACTADPTTCACGWVLSQALTEVFLPFRKENMIAYLKQVGTGESAWAGGGWGPCHARVKGSPDN